MEGQKLGGNNRRDVFLELTWQVGEKGMLSVADRCVDVSITCMVRPEIYICNTMQSCCQILYMIC